MKKKFLFLSIILFLLFAPVIPAFAQTQTLSVTPSVTRLDLSVDKPFTQIYYTNNSSSVLELSFEAQDFTQLEDGYKLSFLDPKDAQNYQYKLSSWISFSTKSLVLSPHEQQKITIYVNADELTPGGHYSTILAHVTSRENPSSTITIQSTIASLLFVRTNTGKETEQGNISDFQPVLDGVFLPFPTSAFFRFNNTGDTDLTPYGLVTITDSHGKIVAKGIVNVGSLVVLPESIRRLDVSLRNLDKIILPGWYNATLGIHFGKTNQVATVHSLFFTEGSIPLGEILTTASILAFGFWFLRKRLFRKKQN